MKLKKNFSWWKQENQDEILLHFLTQHFVHSYIFVWMLCKHWFSIWCSIWALQVRIQFMVIPQIYFYILCILFSLCFPVSTSSFLPIVQQALPTNVMKLPWTEDSYGSQQRWDCMVVQYQKWSGVHANSPGKTQYMYREKTPADFFPFLLKGVWIPWFFNR